MIFSIVLVTSRKSQCHPIHGHRNSNCSLTVDMFNATLFRSFFANILFCFSFFVFTEIFTLFLLYNRVLTFLWQKQCSTFFPLHHSFRSPYHFNHSQEFFFFFFFGGGPPKHTLQYLSKIKVLARHVVCDECNVLFPPKCVIFM